MSPNIGRGVRRDSPRPHKERQRRLRRTIYRRPANMTASEPTRSLCCEGRDKTNGGALLHRTALYIYGVKEGGGKVGSAKTIRFLLLLDTAGCDYYDTIATS